MFLTNSDELQGRFRLGETDILFWSSINLTRCDFTFLVEGVGLDGDALGLTAHLVSDVATVKAMWEGGLASC